MKGNKKIYRQAIEGSSNLKMNRTLTPLSCIRIYIKSADWTITPCFEELPSPFPSFVPPPLPSIQPKPPLCQPTFLRPACLLQVRSSDNFLKRPLRSSMLVSFRPSLLKTIATRPGSSRTTNERGYDYIFFTFPKKMSNYYIFEF